MTFLYDDKIIAKFSECVENVKKAQHMPERSGLVKKLIHNLDSQINISDSGQRVVSDPGAELSYENLYSLNDLLIFLHVNRINYLNHDIVTSTNEGDERTPININNNTLYVHTNALTEYLKHLGRVAQETENKVMGSLLNNLIVESQSLVGKNILQTVDVRYKDEFHEGSKLMNAPLSHLSSGGSGTKEITIGDLKSKTPFNDWIHRSVSDVNLAYKNLNHFMFYLFEQFKTYYNRARSVFEEELYKTALNRLMSLGTSFNISFKNTDESKQQLSNDNVNRSRLLTNVLDNLPLRNENISIERINAFFNQLVKVDRKYNSFKNSAMDHLNKASAMTIAGLTTFPLTSDFKQVQQGLKNGTINNFYIYTEHLMNAIGVVLNSLHNFKATFAKELKGLSGADNAILLQVGGSPADLSLYRNNIDSLNDMRRRLSASVKTQHKK